MNRSKDDIRRSAAVVALGFNNFYGCDEDEFTFPDGVTPPTEEAIQTKLAELHTSWDAQEYARDRASAYPSTGDQLDMQYHDQLDGTTTWKDAVAKVKSDNPKP